jgi:hypothetical protein
VFSRIDDGDPGVHQVTLDAVLHDPADFGQIQPAVDAHGVLGGHGGDGHRPMARP